MKSVLWVVETLALLAGELSKFVAAFQRLNLPVDIGAQVGNCDDNGCGSRVVLKGAR